MIIPDSIKAMIADEAIHKGIIQLVPMLNGKKMVAESWDQSREYAKALSMAALARSDYVLLMHDLWDATWGAAGALDLGKPDDSEPSDPHYIWENDEIQRYVTLAKPLGACRHAVFCIECDLSKEITLSVMFEDSDYNELPAPEGILAEGSSWYFKDLDHCDHPVPYSTAVLSKDLPTAADTLHKDAAECIARLKAIGA